MKRLLASAALALVVLTGVTACAPRPASGPATSWPQGTCKGQASVPPAVGQAILEAFASYGQTVVNEAGRVSCCESSWVGGDSGTGYLGLFQIGPNGYQTLRFYSAHRFGYGAWAPLDYWVNSQTARDFYVSRGRTWGAFSCRP